MSGPSKNIEDKDYELNLKLKYLYEKRNSFTHKLDQHHLCSLPIMSNLKFDNGASWNVTINNSKLKYSGVHQKNEIINGKDAISYTTTDWPFVLFETIYKILDMPFDRTDINLLFQVEVFHKGEKGKDFVTTFDKVQHKYLKDYKNYFKL